MKLIIPLLFVLLTVSAFGQKPEKVTISDTVPGWFRHSRNTHAVLIQPNFQFARIFSESNKLIGRTNVPGFTASYNYYPIKRLAFGLFTSYNYYFNAPTNNFQNVLVNLELKYFFYAKNRVAFYPYLGYGSSFFSGFSNINYGNFPGVKSDGQFFRFQSNFIGFGAGISWNVFNNMTFNYHVVLLKYITNPIDNRSISLFSLYYHFNRKPHLNRSHKTFKECFKRYDRKTAVYPQK